MPVRPLRSIAAALLLLSIYWLSFDVSPARAADGSLVGYRICLDPGHGGDDPGIVNGALRESDITLDVAHALRWILESNGATVIMTRSGDSLVEANDRIDLCDDGSADFLISLHLGSDRLSAVDGPTTRFFQPDDKLLAQKIHQALASPVLGPVAPDAAFTDFGLVKSPAPVIKRSSMPAAQAEPVHLTNPAEAAALVQRAYDPGTLALDATCNATPDGCRRLQIARALHFGILLHLGITS